MEPELAVRRDRRLVQRFEDREESIVPGRLRRLTEVSKLREKEPFRSALLFEAAPCDWVHDVVWDVASQSFLAFVFSLGHFCGLFTIDNLISRSTWQHPEVSMEHDLGDLSKCTKVQVNSSP